MTDSTYCAKSNDCKNTDCPKHLNGFNGVYVSLAEFDCEELEENDDNDGNTK